MQTSREALAINYGLTSSTDAALLHLRYLLNSFVPAAHGKLRQSSAVVETQRHRTHNLPSSESSSSRPAQRRFPPSSVPDPTAHHRRIPGPGCPSTQPSVADDCAPAVEEAEGNSATRRTQHEGQRAQDNHQASLLHAPPVPSGCSIRPASKRCRTRRDLSTMHAAVVRISYAKTSRWQDNAGRTAAQGSE